MRKTFWLILLIIVPPLILIAMGGYGYFWWRENTKAPSDNKMPVAFVITKGASASQVGIKLQEQKIIKSALAFKIYIKLSNRVNQIKPGEYRLNPGVDLEAIILRLTKGPDELWVTIPEGLRREQLPARFVEALGIADGIQFTAEFNKAAADFEGYLYPDTYLFAKDAKASFIVNKMVSTFNKKVDEQILADIKSSGTTLDKIVIMASIIERETKKGAERPIVAGILYKRMELGMPLQVDATIQYAVVNSQLTTHNSQPKDWWPTIYREDYQIKSSFNTYLNLGLPPAPIASPGISAIEAAIYPEKSGYLFYIHDKNGTIHYAKTLVEHNQNVRTYIGN